MSSPKIQSVQVIDDYTLLIEFDHHEKRRYDVRPLFQKEMFQPLRNPAFLKNVSVAAGVGMHGCGIPCGSDTLRFVRPTLGLFL